MGRVSTQPCLWPTKAVLWVDDMLTFAAGVEEDQSELEELERALQETHLNFNEKTEWLTTVGNEACTLRVGGVEVRDREPGRCLVYEYARRQPRCLGAVSRSSSRSG